MSVNCTKHFSVFYTFFPGASTRPRSSASSTLVVDIQFGTVGNEDGQFTSAWGIGVLQNGEFAVTDIDRSKGIALLYIFGSDGYKSTFYPVDVSKRKDVLIHPFDVALTPSDQLVIVDTSKYAKLYDTKQSLKFCNTICTLSQDDDPKTKVSTQSVAVTPAGNIIIGDCLRRLITIHNEANVWVPKKVEIPIMPAFLATNSIGQILVSGSEEKGKSAIVLAIDDNGKEVFTIDQFDVDGGKGYPQGLVCDGDELYIAVIRHGENHDTVLVGTGHIHLYTNQGQFKECLIKGLYCPNNLAMSKDGYIYVANDASVLQLRE